MKRVIIICEGETEREFCKNVLAPHLTQHHVFIQAPLIKRSMGGIVRWPILKKEIETHLLESGAVVSTFIDYYGLYQKYDFPKWSEGEIIVDKNSRMDFLENAMKEDLPESFKHRFIPYLQLHEFEGLLFNDIQLFYDQVPKNELVGIAELKKTFRAHVILDAAPWVFGVVCSRMHMVWTHSVAGRLESRINYSSTICWNNFPFPDITTKQKENLNLYVFAILDERAKHPSKTMAQLYNPSTMPKGLLQAH